MFLLSILGGAILEGSDGIVRGRASHRRRLALLSILALARGRSVGREKLIGLLWPEHSGDAARRLLSESLYVLKKELGENAFVVAGDEIALNRDMVGSDVDRFETALAERDFARAAELYRGPLLDGFYLTEADEFERWAEGERDRLAHAAARALELAAEEREAEGDFLGAAEWWRRRSALDHFSSRIVLRRMRALELAGEHLAALRVAAEYAEALAHDLGAAPDPEVLAYAERLRTSPPAGRVPPRPNLVEATVVHPDATPSPSALSRVDDVGLHDTVESIATLPPARSRRRRTTATAMLTTATALALAALWLRFDGRAAKAAEPTLDPHRVAVLYFDDYSPGKRLEHLAGILTEDLIDDLSRVEALDVVSRNGVKPFRHRDADEDSIARRLRAGTLIEGSIRESAGRIRVTVRVVDVAHGGKLRSRTLESRSDELFALEDGLAREVSQFLRVQLGRDVRARELAAETRSVRARELVYQAQGLMDQVTRLAASGIEPDSQTKLHTLASADSLLSLASARDERWTLPIVLRGWATLRSCPLRPASEQPGCYDRALASAEAALRLRPGEARALELRGTVRWWSVSRRAVDPPEQEATVAASIRDLRAAVTADSSLARGWATLSQVLRISGRLTDADRAARRALAEDEYIEEAPLILERLYRSSLYLARFDSAASYCERGARQFPDDYRFVECRLNLLSYEGGGHPDLRRARALQRELTQIDPPEASRAAGRAYTPLYRTMAVAKIAARAGQRDTAEALIQQVRIQVGEDLELRLSFAQDEAHVRLLLSQRDSVFPLLSYFLRGRPHDRGFIGQSPAFRSLHGDVRFDSLVSERRRRATAEVPAARR